MRLPLTNVPIPAHMMPRIANACKMKVDASIATNILDVRIEMVLLND
jgi:hypothetical protein